jgi:hypothetical protein
MLDMRNIYGIRAEKSEGKINLEDSDADDWK